MHFLAIVAVLVYGADGKPARAPDVAEAVRAAGDVPLGADDGWAGAIDKRVWIERGKLDFFRRGATLTGEGRAALGRVQLDEAADKLAQAEAVYGDELGQPGAASEAALAALWHGVALFELGRRGEAEAAFRRAVDLEPATALTEKQVRPDVVRAFEQAARTRTEAPPRRATSVTPPPRVPQPPPTADAVAALFDALELDDVLLVAVGNDRGERILAAQRMRPDCVTATVIGPRADELWRRARAAGCEQRRAVDFLQAQPIAHPRPPLVAAAVKPPPARVPAWRKPWMWMGIVGALGLGAVVVANVVPRAATYSGTLDFRSFALTRR